MIALISILSILSIILIALFVSSIFAFIYGIKNISQGDYRGVFIILYGITVIINITLFVLFAIIL